MGIPTLAHASILAFFAATGLIHSQATATTHPQDESNPPPDATATCPVTVPNGFEYTADPAGGNHGNEDLITELWPGQVDFRPGGPGCVEPDGYLGMKWPWWRSVPGPLTIEGHRLDGSAGPLRAHIPTGYGEVGFQPAGVLFAGPGCWEVTGRVGDATVTFIPLVVKHADGPTARCRAIFGGFRPTAHRDRGSGRGTRHFE